MTRLPLPNKYTEEHQVSLALAACYRIARARARGGDDSVAIQQEGSPDVELHNKDASAFLASHNCLVQSGEL